MRHSPDFSACSYRFLVPSSDSLIESSNTHRQMTVICTLAVMRRRTQYARTLKSSDFYRSSLYSHLGVCRVTNHSAGVEDHGFDYGTICTSAQRYVFSGVSTHANSRLVCALVPRYLMAARESSNHNDLACRFLWYPLQ